MQRVNKDDWKYWGRWRDVTLFTSPWMAWPETKVFCELNTVGLKGDCLSLDGYQYLLKSDLDRIADLATASFQGKESWLESVFDLADFWTKKMVHEEESGHFDDFFDAMIEALACSIFIQLADFTTENYLQNLCEKNKISFAEVVSSIHSSKQTPLLKFQDVVRELEADKIDKILLEYGWVGTHGFRGEPLTKERLLQESRLSVAKHYAQNIYKFPLLIEQYRKVACKMVFYRNNIVEEAGRLCYNFWPLLETIAKKHDIDFSEIIFLKHQELIEIINGRSSLPEDLRIRLDGFGIVNIGRSSKLVTGKDLEEYLHVFQNDVNETTILRGRTAFGGIVKGTVRVLSSGGEIYKVREGDILVANETTPEYVPAMKLAAAIVTSHGGITSHAAIIARELRKPCVVGTKIATDVLNDGDLVEVDADKGIVTKLE